MKRALRTATSSTSGPACGTTWSRTTLTGRNSRESTPTSSTVRKPTTAPRPRKVGLLPLLERLRTNLNLTRACFFWRDVPQRRSGRSVGRGCRMVRKRNAAALARQSVLHQVRLLHDRHRRRHPQRVAREHRLRRQVPPFCSDLKRKLFILLLPVVPLQMAPGSKLLCFSEILRCGTWSNYFLGLDIS